MSSRAFADGLQPSEKKENHIDDGLTEPLFVKGEKQTDEYRDKAFAYAFYAQFIGIIVTALVLAPTAFDASEEDAEDGNNEDDTAGPSMAQLVTLFGLTTIGIAVSLVGALKLMMQYADSMVQVAFFAAPVVYGVGALLLWIAGADGAAQFDAILTAVVGLASVCFYTCFKKYMAYATSTLRAALSAIQVNKGLLLMAFITLLAIYAWIIIWTIAVVGVFARAAQQGQVECQVYNPSTDQYEQQMCDQPPNGFALILLILGLYWTQQVIQNVLHVTTAGTVGCFWFSPLSNPSFCSRDVVDSFSRAMTYSFGSICFGSLIVAILNTLEEMMKSARRQRNGALLACILQCILYCVRRYVKYFNSWAYCYVGLYGYDYLTAGKNVIALFTNRGWTVIISDRLIFRVIYMVHVTIGGLAGSLALLTDVAVGPILTDGTADGDAASRPAAFFVGLIMGLIFSRTSLFVINGAVRTIIVCYAEDPGVFAENHPILHAAMQAGWSETYPELLATPAPSTELADALIAPEGEKSGLTEARAVV